MEDFHRGEVKELAALSRILTQSGDRDIQKARLRLAWEDQEREDAQIDEIRLEVFGTPPINFF